MNARFRQTLRSSSYFVSPPFFVIFINLFFFFVSTTWQHTELAIKLGRLYVELCKQGDVASFGWSLQFRCNFLAHSDVDKNVQERIPSKNKEGVIDPFEDNSDSYSR